MTKRRDRWEDLGVDVKVELE